jgi:hypothetical protein
VGRTSRDGGEDGVGHAIDVFDDIVVPETQDDPAETFKMHRASGIFIRCSACCPPSSSIAIRNERQAKSKM